MSLLHTPEYSFRKNKLALLVKLSKQTVYLHISIEAGYLYRSYLATKGFKAIYHPFWAKPSLQGARVQAHLYHGNRDSV